MTYDMVDAKKTMGDTLHEIALERRDIVLISTDSASRSGFGDFIKDFPERYFELGIMEQSALSVAAGLAAAGKVPVFCAPAPFVTGRPYEMFRIDLGYMRQNAKIIGRNCGFNYSDLGPTHYGLDDIALVRLIPGVAILAPQDATELKGAMKAMLEYEGPVYLRLSSAPMPRIFPEASGEPFVIGKGRVIREGKDVAIITTGEITRSVLDATETLVAGGLEPMVIGMPSIHPIDRELILGAARRTGRIVTVEEHYVTGGLGSTVCEICADAAPVPVLRLGAPCDYVSSGPYADIMKAVGLDTESLAMRIGEFARRAAS